MEEGGGGAGAGGRPVGNASEALGECGVVGGEVQRGVGILRIGERLAGGVAGPGGVLGLLYPLWGGGQSFILREWAGSGKIGRVSVFREGPLAILCRKDAVV